MTRNRINLLLLALLAVLGAIALWGPTPPEDRGAPELTLTPMHADQVRHVSVQRPDLEGPLRLERTAEGWRLYLPGRDTPLPADEFKAQRLTELAEAKVYDRFPLKEEQRATYGLDEPRARVTLNAVELVFGGTEPLRHRRYVLADGQVQLIDDRYYDPVSARPSAFVSRALLPGEPALQAVRLPDFTVHRGEGGWVVQGRADPGADALQGFVDAWRRARALQVRLPEEAPAKTAGEVVLERTDGGSHRFLIVKRQPRLVLWDPQRRVEYEFAAYTAERLLDPDKHRPEPPPQDEDDAGGDEG